MNTSIRLSSYIFFISLILICYPLLSQSNDTSAEDSKVVYEVDMDLGEEINEVCAGCHGEYAEGGKAGEYPRIAGFPAEYLRQQLDLFKQNKRHNMPMKPYANDRELTGEDIYSVTAYLEQIKLQTTIPEFKPNTTAYEKLLIAKQVLNIPKVEGDIELGKKLYNDECKICHGKEAKGKKNSSVPPLSGQYTQYIMKQIKDYNNKKRHHDYDDEDDAFKAYSPEQLQAILAYLSVTDD